METHRIRQLPVVGEEGRLAGIVSKRDVYAAALSSLTKDGDRKREFLEAMTAVREIMTTEVETARSDEDLAAVAARLQELRVGALPVVGDDRRLLGLISSSDFLGIVVQLLQR